VAIGASSGGIEALQCLLEDLDAIVLVVLHRPANRASYLRDILVRKCHMPIVVARHGERLHHGVCYIGDPSQHLMVGPRSPGRPVARSSIHDPQYRSAVHFAGSALRSEDLGVVLSGRLDDGTRGLAAIKKAGGIAMVQSPDEAAYPEMPRNAIKYDGAVDLIAPISDLAAEIIRVTGTSASRRLASSR
jgi:two-component system, chemotaxis family, protein-glutamate methylesterase/glutaminase